MDYSSEIPFEKLVPVGRYNPGQEETPNVDLFKSNITLQQIEQKRRDDEEKKNRALDAKRLRKLKEKNLPKAVEAIKKAKLDGIELL